MFETKRETTRDNGRQRETTRDNGILGETTGDNGEQCKNTMYEIMLLETTGHNRNEQALRRDRHFGHVVCAREDEVFGSKVTLGQRPRPYYFVYFILFFTPTHARMRTPTHARARAHTHTRAHTRARA